METLIYLMNERTGDITRGATPNEIWTISESKNGYMLIDGVSYCLARVTVDEDGNQIAEAV